MSGKELLKALPGQLHGTVRAQDVTISGAYPTLLPSDPLADRKDFLVHNNTGVTIWVGGVDVTHFDGLPIQNGASLTLPLGRSRLYGVTEATTTSGVRVLEIA
jgi:hypothetical protein